MVIRFVGVVKWEHIAFSEEGVLGTLTHSQVFSLPVKCKQLVFEDINLQATPKEHGQQEHPQLTGGQRTTKKQKEYEKLHCK